MIRVLRQILIGSIAIACAGTSWAEAPAPTPAPPPSSPAAAGGATPSGAPADAHMWQRLRQVQRNIPTDPRRELPFADVQPQNGRYQVPTLRVRHSDETGSLFRAVRVVYRLDGRELVSLEGDAEAARANVNVFKGRVTPGRHTIEAFIRVKGYGYGIFSYMKHYRVGLSTSREFDVGQSGQTQVTVRLKERNTNDLQRRFHIDIQVEGGRPSKQPSPRIGAL